MSAIAWDNHPALGAGAPRRRRVGQGMSPAAVMRGSRVDAPSNASAGTGSVRLTRRGRAVVIVLASILALGAGLSAQRAMADGPADAVPVVARTVAAGETLWAIAGEVAGPGQDIRDVVDRIAEVNGLDGVELQAGQQILVPAQS